MIDDAMKFWTKRPISNQKVGFKGSKVQGSEVLGSEVNAER